MTEEKKLQIDNGENINDPIWWFLLFGLIQDVTESKWSGFVSQLMHENRFSSSHEVVDLVCAVGDTVAKTIPKGTKLYRARIFKEKPLEKVINDLFDTNCHKEKKQSNKNTFLYSLIGLLSEGKETALRYKIIHQFEDEYRKWEKKKFKGYNKRESGKPPKEKAIEGRVNPEYISYLYLAEDALTSIYEVHPVILQLVSVAEFLTLKDLRIYDFAYSFPNDYNNENKFDISLFNHISQMFSLPYEQKPLQYLPTQYIGEVIKKQGFDGLRFRSSVRQNGYNIVLFDDSFCKAVSSDYIQINGINLEIGNPDMYELGNMITALDNK